MSDWLPPSTFEERLKELLVPARLYHVLRAHRERRRGDRELALLPFLADPGRNSVDAGANKGVYTYWLQKCSRHVYAYEPNPKIFRILEAGARGNVSLLPYALADSTGTARLRIPKTERGYSNQGGSLNFAKVGPSYGELEVETRRLDDEGLHDIGLIKIDVEGFEFEVLEGARETIERDRPVLLIEIEEVHNKQPIEDSLARIEALGYRGSAVIGGILRDLSLFDPEANHRAWRQRADYVFNFVFFPSTPVARRAPRQGAGAA